MIMFFTISGLISGFGKKGFKKEHLANKYEVYDKLSKTLNSCKSPIHFVNFRKMLVKFSVLYNDDYLCEFLYDMSYTLQRKNLEFKGIE